jgi:hypothetical protein
MYDSSPMIYSQFDSGVYSKFPTHYHKGYKESLLMNTAYVFCLAYILVVAESIDRTLRSSNEFGTDDTEVECSWGTNITLTQASCDLVEEFNSGHQDLQVDL